jgi:hypothetical protein
LLLQGMIPGPLSHGERKTRSLNYNDICPFSGYLDIQIKMAAWMQEWALGGGD